MLLTSRLRCFYLRKLRKYGTLVRQEAELICTLHAEALRNSLLTQKGPSRVEEEMNNQQKRPFKAGQGMPVIFDEMRPVNPKSVLRDLFELLEEYAPTWYTEELRDRAEAALLNRAS